MSWWNSQYNKGKEHTLQFGTKDIKAFKYIEKCCQKVMDNAYGWISVKDRLPEINQKVLCFCRGDIYEVFKYLGSDGWHSPYNRAYYISFVTHWMPLPEPPESEE